MRSSSGGGGARCRAVAGAVFGAAGAGAVGINSSAISALLSLAGARTALSARFSAGHRIARTGLSALRHRAGELFSQPLVRSFRGIARRFDMTFPVPFRTPVLLEKLF